MNPNSNDPKIISGGIHKDSRGIIRFVNDFKLKNVCRFYTIEHTDTKTVRAWQGHKSETKYFYPLKGKFVLAWVKIDNFENPSDNLTPNYKIVSFDKPVVIHIPPGYANGLRALEPNSILGVFSDMEVNLSINEKIRFAPDKWFNWFQDFE